MHKTNLQVDIHIWRFYTTIILQIDWLILWCLTPFSTVFQLYRGAQCTYLCSPGVLLTSAPHDIPSNPLAAFPHSNCRNNGQQWEKNEPYCNDYLHSSERILAKQGIELAASFFKSATLPTDPWSSAIILKYLTNRFVALTQEYFGLQHNNAPNKLTFQHTINLGIYT